ncbi:HAD family hydrolase [Ursidibacter sp. B-7004-1]
MKNKAVVLDLDDTLYSELDFLKSGYKHIAKKLESDNYSMLFNTMMRLYFSGENVFSYIIRLYQNVTLAQLLDWYRYHQPSILLYSDVYETLALAHNKYKLAVVTDGRSVTQRNKLAVLGLNSIIDDILISEEIGSEKPSMKNFKLVEERFQCDEYVYIGDNTKKDFVTPNELGWETVCLLDKGFNIHKQDFSLPRPFLPHYVVEDWLSIKQILKI